MNKLGLRNNFIEKSKNNICKFIVPLFLLLSFNLDSFAENKTNLNQIFCNNFWSKDSLLVTKSLDLFMNISKFSDNENSFFDIYADGDRKNMPKYKVYAPKTNSSWNWMSIDVVYEQINLFNFVLQVDDSDNQTLTIKNNDSVVYKINFSCVNGMYVISNDQSNINQDLYLILEILNDINNYFIPYIVK